MAITAEFTADFSQFTAATADAESSLGRLKEAATGMAIDHQVRVAGQAVSNLATQITGFATEYINAFAEEEAATSRLAVALKNSGLAADDTITVYARMAAQFQQTTRFADDAVTAAQTVLTSIGKIGPDQMEPAIQAAANLAASLGIGLEEAARKIATVIATDGAKLGVLKGYLSDVEIKGKDAAEIIGIFNSKFGGAAAADMGTTTGQLKNFNNQLDDFKEKVGGVLSQGLTPLLTAFNSLPSAMQTTIVAVGLLGAALAPIIIAVGTTVTAFSALATLLLGPAGATAAFTAVVAVLTGPVALAIAGVIAAAAAVYLAFKNWDQIVVIVKAVYNAIKTYLVDQFNGMVNSILHPIDTVTNAFKTMYDKVVGHSYVPEMMDEIGAQFARLDEVMVQPAKLATEATTQAFAGAKQMMASLIGGSFPSTASLDTVARTAGSMLGFSNPWFGTAASTMPTGIGSVANMPYASNAGGMFANITVNGNLLSTKDELAGLVQDAMMQSYRRGGNLQPV